MEETPDLFMGTAIMASYCGLNGHFWTDADECVICGQSWDELHEVVVTPHADGSVAATVEYRLPLVRP